MPQAGPERKVGVTPQLVFCSCLLACALKALSAIGGYKPDSMELSSSAVGDWRAGAMSKSCRQILKTIVNATWSSSTRNGSPSFSGRCEKPDSAELPTHGLAKNIKNLSGLKITMRHHDIVISSLLHDKMKHRWILQHY